MGNHYEITERIVKSGNSSVLNSWKSMSNITDEEFLAALKWLYDDPQNGGNDGRHMTREIGLEEKGIIKLERVYSKGLCFFYTEDGRSWSGAIFHLPPQTEAEEIWANDDGLIPQQRKICLSARDRI